MSFELNQIYSGFKLTKKEENVDSSHQFKKKNSSKILIDDRLIAKNSYRAQKIDKEQKHESNEKILSVKKVERWAGLQFIKAILGIPIIPGSN